MDLEWRLKKKKQTKKSHEWRVIGEIKNQRTQLRIIFISFLTLLTKKSL